MESINDTPPCKNYTLLYELSSFYQNTFSSISFQVDDIILTYDFSNNCSPISPFLPISNTIKHTFTYQITLLDAIISNTTLHSTSPIFPTLQSLAFQAYKQHTRNVILKWSKSHKSSKTSRQYKHRASRREARRNKHFTPLSFSGAEDDQDRPATQNQNGLAAIASSNSPKKRNASSCYRWMKEKRSNMEAKRALWRTTQLKIALRSKRVSIPLKATAGERDPMLRMLLAFLPAKEI